MKRNYIGLWLLLAVSLLIVVILSSLRHVRLFGVELRSSGIVEALTKPVEKIDTAAAPRLAAKTDTATKKPTFPVPLDTASHRILFIGDSMLEGLSPRLAAYAKANGHTLNSVIWYSSTSQIWAESDTLAVYLKRFKPTYIFISLGGNELFVKDIKTKRDKHVKALLSQIGNIPYVWIGPPNWKPDTGINDLIAENVPRGSFFLSNGMTFERSADGAHPTRASAALWLDSIARWMPAHCNHPIKMQLPPADMHAKPDCQVMLAPKI